MSKKNIIYLLIGVVITCIVFGNFLNMHYATDTYNIINRGYINYAVHYSLNDGRVLMCLIGVIAGVLKIPINFFVVSLTLLAIIVSNITIIILKNFIENYKKPKTIFEDIVLFISCYSVIFNFMWLENMQYVECFVMALSILLNVLAAKSFVENKLLKTILLVTIGVFCYQGTLHSFVVFVVLFLIISDSYKNIYKNILKSVLICIMVCLLNFITIKIVGNLLEMELTRVNFKNIHTMCLAIFVSLPDILLYTRNMFPAGCFIIMLTVLVVFYNRKREMLLFIILSIISCFGLSLFTSSAFAAPRMLFGLGALIGNCYLMLYVKSDVKYSVIAVVYVVVLVLNYFYIINEHEKVYNYTQNECSIIKEYIDEYEQTSGTKIKYIAIYNDDNPTYYCKEIKNRTSLCIRPLSVEWSDEAAINYFCNISLNEIMADKDIYMKYFYNKDWDELNREQFVFVRDALHYCVY